MMVFLKLIGLCRYKNTYWGCICRAGTSGKFCQTKEKRERINGKAPKMEKYKKSGLNEKEYICQKRCKFFFVKAKCKIESDTLWCLNPDTSEWLYCQLIAVNVFMF